MISKERLEELIKQGAKVFYFDPYEDEDWGIVELDTKNFHFSHNENCYTNFCEEIYKISPQPYKIFRDDLYEIKEDAEFIAKYHTNRTEYFEPPTWEEFEKRKFYDFLGKDGRTYYIQHLTYCDLLVVYDNGDCYTNQLTGVVIDHTYENTNIFKGAPTKENYYKAVEKAKELFLGEAKC